MAYNFQERVWGWVKACFGEGSSTSRGERTERFVEEAIELAQAAGMSKDDMLKLVDYVYNRPAGELSQEVGGVMTTLAAFCSAHGVDMMHMGVRELSRVSSPEMIEKIRMKQASKPASSPLPGSY